MPRLEHNMNIEVESASRKICMDDDLGTSSARLVEAIGRTRALAAELKPVARNRICSNARSNPLGAGCLAVAVAENVQADWCPFGDEPVGEAPARGSYELPSGRFRNGLLSRQLRKWTSYEAMLLIAKSCCQIAARDSKRTIRERTQIVVHRTFYGQLSAAIVVAQRACPRGFANRRSQEVRIA